MITDPLTWVLFAAVFFAGAAIGYALAVAQGWTE